MRVKELFGGLTAEKHQNEIDRMNMLDLNEISLPNPMMLSRVILYIYSQPPPSMSAPSGTLCSLSDPKTYHNVRREYTL